MPQQRTSVFISGTFSDMVPWRTAAMRGIGAARMVARDLADEVKDGRRTIEFIEHELAINDIYLGVFGVRYGERVDGQPDAPSWTHYEFLYFYNHQLKSRQAKGLMPMLMLHPAEESEAHTRITRDAGAVLETLDPPVAESDLAAQKAFLRTIREGGCFIEHAVLQRLEVLSLSHDTSCRLLETYSSETDLKLKVENFLHRNEIRLLRTELDSLPGRAQPPRAEPSLPRLSPRDLARLGAATAGPALCVVTQPGGDATAAQTARALTEANPGNAEIWDTFVDLANAPLDPALSGDALLELITESLCDLLDFDNDGDPAPFDGLAEHVVMEGRLVMVRVSAPRLPTFNLGKFARKLWHPLAMALDRAHRAHGARTAAEYGEAGRLFLVLASEKPVQRSTALGSYQTLAAPRPGNPEKPVLLSADAAAQDIPPKPERPPDRAIV